MRHHRPELGDSKIAVEDPEESRNFKIGSNLPGIFRQESCDVTKCGGLISPFAETKNLLSS